MDTNITGIVTALDKTLDTLTDGFGKGTEIQALQCMLSVVKFPGNHYGYYGKLLDGIAYSTVAANFGRLEDYGFIETKPDPTCRRRKIVFPTKKAERLLNIIGGHFNG